MESDSNALFASVVFMQALISGAVLVGLGVYQTMPQADPVHDARRRRRGYTLMVVGTLLIPVGLWVSVRML